MCFYKFYCKLTVAIGTELGSNLVIDLKVTSLET